MLRYLLLAITVTTCLSNAPSYQGYQIIKIHLRKDPLVLLTFQSCFHDDLHTQKLQVLSQSRTILTVAVAPELQEILRLKLCKKDIEFWTIDFDLHKSINDAEKENKRYRAEYLKDFNKKELTAPSCYLCYDEQVAWLEWAVYLSSIAKLFSIGKSSEGRIIWGVQINCDENLPAVWLHANIHASDWLSSHTALYIIKEILTGRSKDAYMLRKNYRFYIVPNVNPDGYEYSYNKDRLWSRTRSKHQKTDDCNCQGVDANRNFKYEFGGPDCSDDPCKNNYRGPRAFSEPETAAIQEYLTKLLPTCQRRRLHAAFALGAYGQHVFFPYSHGKRSNDHVELLRVAEKAAATMKAVDDVDYEAGTIQDIVGITRTGGFMDWAKQCMNVTYPYEIDLRPTVDNPESVLLSPCYIEPTGAEAFAGFASAVFCARP